MVIIDGSFGEGGGQILRTSLALSLVTGKPFRIEKIRAGRKRPGLLSQHLTAVKAAAEIGKAEVTSATLGSMQLTFVPRQVSPGDYAFATQTAGSATLVLQTVLPALMLASAPSHLKLEGGTHNPFAPPFDFLAKTFLPLINRMGPRIEAVLERPGFYPAGGGKFNVTIEPVKRLKQFELNERGQILSQCARVVVAKLPRHIAERELAVIKRKMAWDDSWLQLEVVENSAGPGNVVSIEIACEHLTEVFTGFGQRGVPAETVAHQAVEAAQRYLAAEVAAGEHLADQLLIPMALAGGGSFTTFPLSSHATTNRQVIQQFLEVKIEIAIRSASSRQVIIRT